MSVLSSRTVSSLKTIQGVAVLGIATLVPLMSTRANAIPLGTSDATAIANVSCTLPNCPDTVTQANNSTPPSAASSASLPGASATVTALPGVFIQTMVSDTGAPSPAFIGGQGAIAHLDYSFMVTGGLPTDLVTVNVATILSTTASSTSFLGFATIDIGTSLSETVCTRSTECSLSNFDGILSLTLNPGVVTPIHFELEASGNATLSGNATASADPYIFIAPSNSNAGDYSIVVSSNVGNEPLVTPLPAALPLFATGLGALGLLGWRRKRKAAA
jgi:hypothetical protein